MSHSPPAFGIDIGAERLHIASGHQRRDQLHIVELTDPAWFMRLAEIIPPGAVVAFEPTGGNYSAPIIDCLAHIGATLLQVEHRVTGYARALRISGTKKDTTDAQTLQFVAEQHVSGVNYRGTHPADPRRDQHVIGLRMLMWAHSRVTKEITRCTNRLRQLAHCLSPILNQKIETYLRAVEAGYVSPADLRDLHSQIVAGHAPREFKNSSAQRSLSYIVTNLPPWLTDTPIREAIAYEAAARRQYQTTQSDLEVRINAIISAEPFLTVSQCWATIPNSHSLVIAALHVATHGKASELTATKFKATVGSHPHISQSGADMESEAARQGFKPAKKYLYLWTMTLIKHGDNPIAEAFIKHKERGSQHAMQAARSELCLILSALARNRQPYDPSRR